ncbi:Uncharacterised protein [Mycobacterium tuberculosis]|nr:Uncharacterised protein [Mycobacterium tuberculosis]CKR67057.1 Uncharacterised protein [Mycobacterium tuberculosis]CKS79804.1 Uncharacterised protein [Mycobacterium tuberculosis]
MANHRVDGRERLVHQQDRRIGRECPCHADPLLFAARELGRVAGGDLGVQPDTLKHLITGFAGCPARLTLQHRHRCDVVDDPLMRHQPRVLDDIANSQAQLHRIDRRHVGTVDSDGARGRIHHSVDHSQRRRLAAAGGADEDGQHAVRDFQRQPVYGGGTVCVHLADIVKADQRGAYCRTG